MSTSPSYKKIDTIPRLLENFWRTFPNVVALDPKTLDPAIGNKIINDGIMVPAIQNSTEFCNLIDNHIINIKPFSKGGFGEVGALTINEDENDQPLEAIVISIKRYGGFEPFYVPVIMKLYFTHDQPKWYISTIYSSITKTKNAIFLSDPLSEMVFGSMVGHLYDMGVCPFFTKYFGAYFCTISNKTSIVTERANFELRQLISRDGPTSITNRPEILTNLLFQYVYTLYIMKVYYGMVHFDTQYRNIMVTYIHNRSIKMGPQPTPYIYQGEDISTKELILFKTHVMDDDLPVYIAIHNTGLLLKLIDYGVCVAHLDRSFFSPYRNNITITSIHSDLTRINASKAYENTILNNHNGTITDEDEISILSRAYTNTIDLQYTLNNVWEHLFNGLDRAVGQKQPDPNAAKQNSKALECLLWFTERFFGKNIKQHLDDHPRQKIQKDGKGRLLWVSYIHDVGLSDPEFKTPLRLIEGLVNVCNMDKVVDVSFKKSYNGPVKLLFFENSVKDFLNSNVPINDDHCMVLNTSASDYQRAMNQFDQWLRATNAYERHCEGHDMVPVECLQIKSDTRKTSYRFLNNKHIYLPTPNKVNGKLDIGRDNLIKSNELFDYYQVQLNPKAKRFPRNVDGAMVYQTYQSWLDLKAVPNSRAGNHIETIFLHVFKLKSIRSIQMLNGIDLWSGSLQTLTEPNGLAINGGYFIVSGNINKLYPKLKAKDIFSPIGYAYNKSSTVNGTILSIPNVYNDDVGVIYGSSNGSLHLERWDDFIARHRTIKDTVRYEDANGQIVDEAVDAISMDDGVLVGKRPNVVDPSFTYDFAFATGPILISGNKVTFDLNKMNAEVMDINGRLVHAVPDAHNAYKYRAADGEGNQYYGMRHSNRFMVHNVVGVDNNGSFHIFLCEGRGFDAPGLDRVQLAYLIQSFGIHSAISLDGGFSANAIYKDCDMDQCKPIIVLNDPEKRKLGLSLYFS